MQYKSTKSEDEFAESTYQTDCLETDVLSLRDVRQISLEEDLGIYVKTKNGIQGQSLAKRRLDAVRPGKPGTLVSYVSENEVTSTDWVQIADGQMKVDGVVHASDIFVSREGSTSSVNAMISDMKEKTDSFIQILDTIKSSLLQRLDLLNDTTQQNLGLLESQLQQTQERMQILEGVVRDALKKDETIKLSDSDPQEAQKWTLKTGQEKDGRKSLMVCYENQVSSKFMTPKRLEPPVVIAPAQTIEDPSMSTILPEIPALQKGDDTQASILSPVLSTLMMSPKLSATKTPSKKTPASSARARKNRTPSHVETIDIPRPKISKE